MTVRQQWLAVCVVLLLVATGVMAGATLLKDELFQVSVGSRAPDFHAITLDSTPVAKTIADYRGEVVLINIWATWCGPCRIEMPSIQRLHETYGPRGLKIVAVSVDSHGFEKVIRSFAQEYALGFEILYDTSGVIQRDYQTTGVPETFIIGRDRVIRKKVIGATDWNSEANRALIERLLAEQKS